MLFLKLMIKGYDRRQQSPVWRRKQLPDSTDLCYRIVKPEILLETEQGMLHIKGKDLHVNRLDLDKGEVDIDGQVDALNYSQVPGRKGSIIGKFFTS